MHTDRASSDLDLCYMDPIPFAVRGQIEEDFEQSYLPFIVECHDFTMMSSEFQQRIKDDLVVVQRHPDR